MSSHLTASQLADPNQRIKWSYFTIYIVLNTALLLILKYAAMNGNDKVISTTEVLMSELIKLVLSILGCFYFDAKCSIYEFKMILWRVIYDDASDLIKLSIPAVLYIIQNNLQYLIETRIILLVIYQFKIVSNAFFYVTMLSRKVYANEWLSILAVTVGVAVVEVSKHDIEGHYHANLGVGLFAVVIAIITSGFAGVYFELVLKASKSSIWLLNIEMSTLSFFLGTVVCSTQNTEEISKYGFFYGYTYYTVIVIILQSVVGLSVALVVNSSDNIHKSFAACISIVFVTFIELILFRADSITQSLLTGSGLVFVSSIAFVIHSHRQYKAAIIHNQHLLQVQTTAVDINMKNTRKYKTKSYIDDNYNNITRPVSAKQRPAPITGDNYIDIEKSDNHHHNSSSSSSSSSNSRNNTPINNGKLQNGQIQTVGTYIVSVQKNSAMVLPARRHSSTSVMQHNNMPTEMATAPLFSGSDDSDNDDDNNNNGSDTGLVAVKHILSPTTGNDNGDGDNEI